MPTTLPAESAAEMFRWVLETAGTIGTLAALGLIAVSAVIGLSLLLWGRVLHRALLVLIAVPIGLVTGWTVGPTVGVHPLLAAGVAGATFGILAIVLARLLWALVAGLHVAGIVLAVSVVWLAGDQWAAMTPPAAGADPNAHAEAVARKVADSLAKDHGTSILLATGLSGLAAVVVAFLLPRVTMICITSLLGAEQVSSAACFAAMLWVPSLHQIISDNPYISMGVMGGLLLVGLAFQTVGELRRRRAAAGGGTSGGKGAKKAAPRGDDDGE